MGRKLSKCQRCGISLRRPHFCGDTDTHPDKCCDCFDHGWFADLGHVAARPAKPRTVPIAALRERPKRVLCLARQPGGVDVVGPDGSVRFRLSYGY